MLDSRSIQLAKTIIQHPYYTMKKLEEVMSLSRRQVNYDFEKINDYLVSIRQSEIVYQRGKGFIFSKSIEEVFQFKVEEVEQHSILLDEGTRPAFLYLYTFTRDEELSLFHLVNVLEVSKNTVLQDMKRLNEELKDFGLEVAYSRSEGYGVKGEELRKRGYALKALTRLLDANQESILFNTIFEKSEQVHVEQLCRWIGSFQEQHQLTFIEERTRQLAYYMLLVKKRIIQGKVVTLSKKQRGYIKGKKELTLAKEILAENVEECPIEEMYFLGIQLMGICHYSEKIVGEEDAIYQLAKQIVDQFEWYACVRFHDEDFVINRLYSHLRPAYYRLLFHIPITNPLKDAIKEKYGDVYEVVEKVLEPLELVVGHDIPEDEVAYVTMHFAAHLKQATKVGKKKQGIVVCPNGVGTSLLIYSQLVNIFPEIQFVGTFSEYEYGSKEIPDHDFVFATKGIQTNKKMFVVPPIIRGRVRAELVQQVHSVLYQQPAQSLAVNQFMTVIEQYADVKNKAALVAALEEVLISHEGKKIERRKPMLGELLTKETVQVLPRVQEWQEGVRLAAKPLLERGCVNEAYIEKMISNVMELGPYINICPMVAIPHARPEDGVHQLGMSLLKLDESVLLLNNEKNAVKLFICLAAVDSDTHLKALSQLTRILGNKEKLQNLLEASCAEEILNIIQEYSMV